MQFLKKDPSDLQFGPKIIPAILAGSFSDLSAKISALENLVEWAQIDVMDGIFVSNYSWPYESHQKDGDDGSSAGDIDDLTKLGTKLSLELHLMINNPEEVLHEWLTHGEVKRVLIHPESTTNLARSLDIIEEQKREAGLSLRLETPLEIIEPFMGRVSTIQLMGIENVGFGGQPFSDAVLPRIKKLRAMFPHCTIEIDGGVTLARAKKLIDAGADILVVGSALFSGGNVASALKTFNDLTSSRR
jgi:ribulose-phosphate 3-epimerase